MKKLFYLALVLSHYLTAMNHAKIHNVSIKNNSDFQVAFYAPRFISMRPGSVINEPIKTLERIIALSFSKPYNKPFSLSQATRKVDIDIKRQNNHYIVEVLQFDCEERVTNYSTIILDIGK